MDRQDPYTDSFVAVLGTNVAEFGTLIKVGDRFWEYHDGVGYSRIAHSLHHIFYFLERYKATTFLTKEELLAAHPDAAV